MTCGEVSSIKEFMVNEYIVMISAEIAKELHKETRRIKEFRKVEAFSVNNIWAMDLISLMAYKDQNRGYNYLLTILDVYSRYAFVRPLKTKTGKEIYTALKSVFTSNKVTPNKVWVDQGGEFYNSTVKKLLKDKGTEMYSTYGKDKVSMIERFNRTLLKKLNIKFTEQGNEQWFHLAPLLVKTYNETPHRGIRYERPIDVWENQELLEIHDVPLKKSVKKFKVGDKVRISLAKTTFGKGYSRGWSFEVFTVTKVNATEPVTYQLTDYAGDLVKGSFYNGELQKTEQGESLFEIEKVLDTRTRNGVKEQLVKWVGWANKYNQWIPVR